MPLEFLTITRRLDGHPSEFQSAEADFALVAATSVARFSQQLPHLRQRQVRAGQDRDRPLGLWDDGEHAAIEACASTTTSLRSARASTAAFNSRSCVAASPDSSAGSAASTKTSSTSTDFPARAAAPSRRPRVGSSVVAAVAATPIL